MMKRGNRWIARNAEARHLYVARTSVQETKYCARVKAFVGSLYVVALCLRQYATIQMVEISWDEESNCVKWRKLFSLPLGGY